MVVAASAAGAAAWLRRRAGGRCTRGQGIALLCCCRWCCCLVNQHGTVCVRARRLQLHCAAALNFQTIPVPSLGLIQRSMRMCGQPARW